MTNFELIYARATQNASSRTSEHVSLELKPLLQKFHEEMISKSANISALKSAVMNILLFLTTPEGRTNANCWAVDLFFSIDDNWQEKWPEVPDLLKDVISDMGGALHDTFGSPEIAKQFDSTPEQLLKRVEEL